MRKFLILILFFLFSCEANDCKDISGVWAIKEMKVNNKDFKSYLDVNTFGFNCENSSGWFQGSYFFERDPNIKWVLIKGKNDEIDSIRIESKIKIYNDIFKINLYQDKETGQNKIELKSKQVYILAYKIIESYK